METLNLDKNDLFGTEGSGHQKKLRFSSCGLPLMGINSN